VRKVVNRRAGAAARRRAARRRDGAWHARGQHGADGEIRLGWDGSSRNVVGWRNSDAGASAVAIHARTRAEKFEGNAHWEMIGDARNAVGIPVIGNGDVRTPEDAARMLETTGCDAVMLGRAAYGDPWVFRRARAFLERGERLPLPTAAERLETGLRHLRMLAETAGPEAAAREMRKHVAWYVRGLPRSAAVREQVNRTRGVEEMVERLSQYLEELTRSGLAHEAAAPSAGAGRDAEDLVAAG
jgi:nifR3 family TIM-barrel protein